MAEEQKKGSARRSVDPATVEMLQIAEEQGIPTAFSRAESMKPCPIGAEGMCCKNCGMGPCRLAGKNKEELTGVCGATASTIAARNFARACAGGSAAHSDHARDMALTLRAIALGEVQDYKIKDIDKLMFVAEKYGIKTEGRSENEIALDVANIALTQFGQYTGVLKNLQRAPKKRQQVWKSAGIEPRAIDREVVETMHRTHIGVDQDAEHILDQALRVSMGDGWGGSMIGTDISDILFGTPKPLMSSANLGVLKDDEVNVVVHGHEPLLSEMIVAASQDPDVIEYAKSKGAKGINLAGICCTSNEIMMRHGIPSAGNFLQQELAIMTGAVDAMIVDVQCVMQGLAPMAQRYHTKLITTSPKAKIPGALHIHFDEDQALSIAKLIIRTAIDNYPNRKAVHIPRIKEDLEAGFSHEYIEYMLGGRYRASFRPLNDAIIDGRIQGVVGIVGCNNPRQVHDAFHKQLVERFIANDYLVVQTGCGALASGKFGLLLAEAEEKAGPGLRSICDATGMPPVLHLGSCVDNSRILTICSAVAEEGGLGEDIADLPIAGIAPEWMSEKALAIGTYFAASGAFVVFGSESPVGGSSEVTRIMTEGWEAKVGGSLHFEPDVDKLYDMVVAHIQKKRDALGINQKKERVLLDMEARRQLDV
jgi:anaerobic carbon-monoxide dehydrogenase catalytic subunit